MQICVEGNTGSTGTMAENIGQIALSKNWSSYIAFGRFERDSLSNKIKIGNRFQILIHGFITRLFDLHGLGSSRATLKLIEYIKILQPDIIHLHHLHGYYINYKILFNYLNNTNIPVVWTFHDCWSFTGHCAHFDYIKCEKWKHICHNCPQKKEYPASYFFDRSKENYILKRSLFTKNRNLIIVSVSKWMENIVRESFFKQTKIFTIHNGIDTKIFKPLNEPLKLLSNILLKNKFIILGVASPWNKKKGFYEFLNLSKIIDHSMIIVMVGLNKSQLLNLPSNIIGIEKTENKNQLANIYSCADVFLNLTLEDNFPTTNIEAMACGTPVITYNTGGSGESISHNTGMEVLQGSLKDVLSAINKVKENGKDFYSNNCRNTAILNYNKETQFEKYFDIYNNIIKNKNYD